LIKIGLTGFSGILGKNLSSLISKKKIYRIYKYRHNVLNKKEVFNWIEKNQFNVIIHLAALVPTKKVNINFSLSKRINIEGTQNLIDGINELQKKSLYFLFSSTSHVYNFNLKKNSEDSKIFGISKYGKTKIAAEKYIRTKSIKADVCIARISSLVSEEQTDNFFLPHLVRKGKSKNIIQFKNSNVVRNFIHVSDVSKILLKLVEKRVKGTINVSTSERTHFKKLFVLLSKKYNFKIQSGYLKPEYLDLSNNLLLKKIGIYNFMKLEKIIEKIYNNRYQK
tara:strand:+ start:1291 stop:2130 length:840 start_codon:yes stop_codon:yes gene_type:complete